MKDQYGLLAPGLAGIDELILRFQRELFVVGAELAANPAATDKLRDGVSRVDESMLAGIETTLGELERHAAIPTEFVVPGESRLSAALELARATIRRAERRAVSLERAEQLPGRWLLPYLNRLADLLWILARVAEQAESRTATPARERPRRT
jgi:cob(I)alamin adenosyltransferase